MIKLTLPYPPSVNMITTIAHGRKITSKRGREYRIQALDVIRRSKVGFINADKLKVELFLYPPTNARRDIDNYSKAVLDALTEGGVYEDDSLIQELIIKKCDKVKDGKVDITISEIN